MAITQTTKDADDRLRKELKNADLEKFKKAVKQVFSTDAQPKTDMKSVATRKKK